MDNGKNIYSRGRDRGRGRGGGRRRCGNHSGFTEQQQRTTRPPVEGNFGAVRGFQLTVQLTWNYRPQQSVQGQSYGPTPPPPSVPPQRAPDNLEIQTPKISEQPASPPGSVENGNVPIRRPNKGWIMSFLGSLLKDFLKDLIVRLFVNRFPKIFNCEA